MAKKSTFLDAVENLTVEPVKIEGIQIGENYSGISSNKKENRAEIKPSETLKVVESIEKPRKVKLKPKIINKPVKQKVNRENMVFKENISLDITLSFLTGLSYEKKIEYFASNGFWIQLERFKNIYWEVATRFINRKKYKIYVKELVGIPNYDDYSKVDRLKIQDMTAEERRVYLCKRGWSIKVMERGKSEYEYATKYINRKKEHIYIGSYSPGTESKQIFLGN